MKQNKYDHPHFYTAYAQMARSIKGLEGAGEWHMGKQLIYIKLFQSICEKVYISNRRPMFLMMVAKRN